jgi:hypothetical protein
MFYRNSTAWSSSYWRAAVRSRVPRRVRTRANLFLCSGAIHRAPSGPRENPRHCRPDRRPAPSRRLALLDRFLAQCERRAARGRNRILPRGGEDCVDGSRFQVATFDRGNARGTESLQTPRWRKADSNSWSHLWMRVSLGETGPK